MMIPSSSKLFSFSLLLLLFVSLSISKSLLQQVNNKANNNNLFGVEDFDGADWMKKANAIIGNKTFHQLTLPGTHDSGTFNLTDYLIEIPEYLIELIELADALDIPVIEIIKLWSYTQDKDYFEQFEAGIRYMDIRVCYDEGQWRNHHGPIGKHKNKRT